jgi:hypothetical protein
VLSLRCSGLGSGFAESDLPESDLFESGLDSGLDTGAGLFSLGGSRGASRRAGGASTRGRSVGDGAGMPTRGGSIRCVRIGIDGGFDPEEELDPDPVPGCGGCDIEGLPFPPEGLPRTGGGGVVAGLEGRG